MVNQGGAPNSFERGQGKALGVCQAPYGQSKFSPNDIFDRYLDYISSFHRSKDSVNNLITLPLS